MAIIFATRRTPLKISMIIIIIFVLLGNKDIFGTNNNYGVEGANILFFTGGISSHSHRSSIQPLVNQLAFRGHSVTLFTPLAPPNGQPSSIKQFCPAELQAAHQEFLTTAGVRAFKARVETPNLNQLLEKISEMYDSSEVMCKKVLNSEALPRWLATEKFDLFIIDGALNTCAFGLAHYFQAKVIIYHSVTMTLPWDNSIFGVPTELSWFPGIAAMSQGGKLTFLDRLVNALTTASFSWTYRSYHLPNIERELRRAPFLGDKLAEMGMPSLENVIRQTALIFVNNHYSDQYPKSYPPFVVPVGGIHLTKESNGSLPGLIENFLGTRKNGEFIYISFGSLIQVSTMPKYLLKIFFQLIQDSEFNFMFKWDGPLPSNSPKNVLFSQWFPQERVLAHPKIRAFITQAGQVSVQQAIFNSVPLLMMPVLGDQDFNAKRMELMGNGVVLEWSGLTKQKLEQALHTLVMEPQYKLNAIKLAKASRDRPMTALDTAVWWVEHVIKTPNEDLAYLKPPLDQMNSTLWQLWCLDLWSFFIISGLLITYFVWRLLKFLLTKIVRLLLKTEGGREGGKIFKPKIM